MMGEDIVIRARAFAEMVHRGNPYYEFHLDDNVRIAAEAGMTDLDTILISYLHDTVEDIAEVLRPLAIAFLQSAGEHVERTVMAMSGFGANRRARNACFYEKIERYPAAANHKLVDRLANMENALRTNPGLLKMYRREDGEFYERVVKLATNPILVARYEAVRK